MTEDTPLSDTETDEALAAELALGLLDGAEAEEAVARLSTDPAFAGQVREWQERLAGLAEGLTPVMAPARARQYIRERLGHAESPLASDPAEGTPWWRGPIGVIGGFFAAAAIAFVLFSPEDRTTPPSQPGYRAELAAEDGAMAVEAILRGREMRIAMQSGAPDEGRDWEVWWLAEGADPVSLGVLPREGDMTMMLPEGLEPSSDARIALSDEPEGGSPTGQATGPVIAVAELTDM
ncbi:anti-sigma factor [Paracoccus sp. 1_MG-2023]|uniref:anti-sigma factor n=1 Tax=unclassified Paracoccus (in: a-proteobacteria) TaxID=2688777 RepID=UPI001C0A184C|nr:MULTISPECIES: anti-sigma factor [unclassified Paracoccus (in: a-proteobacteria)]MBU2958148.1 anti-sigma factor [Paracoccus sp. C2R09]MDO6668275.1 anti-sigma factor [Paracoccus sp. 1_MG-2023]